MIRKPCRDDVTSVQGSEFRLSGLGLNMGIRHGSRFSSSVEFAVQLP